MRKGKTLCPTASLATCLAFAARVLSSSPLTAQEVGTKSVLAPMVIDAHRYGQQVMKHLKADVPMEVRKLLRVLQSKPHDKLLQGSPLARLKVADLPWDLEGIVSDSLEMKLVRFDNQVVNAATSCVVFSTASPLSGSEQAVIWFPPKKRDNLRDENARTKYRILLYVCPGRVKVVKSVGDLIKKLCEELPTLRDTGATYNGWAVVMEMNSSNQQQMAPTTMRVEQEQRIDDNQREAESVAKALYTSIDSIPEVSSSDGCQYARCLFTDTKGSKTRESNQYAVGNLLEYVTNCVELASELQNDQGSLDLVPSALSGGEETTTRSIFSFGKSQETRIRLSQRSSEHELIDMKRDETGDRNVRAKIAKDNSRLSAEVMTGLASNDVLHQNMMLKRGVESASLVELTSAAREFRMQQDTSLGVGTHAFVWQSCDGKVPRTLVLPHHSETRSSSGLETTGILSDGEPIENYDAVHTGLHTDSKDEVDGDVHTSDRGRVSDFNGKADHEGDVHIEDNAIQLLRSSDTQVRDPIQYQALQTTVSKSADDMFALPPHTFTCDNDSGSSLAENDVQATIVSPQSLIDAPRIYLTSESVEKAAVQVDLESAVIAKSNDSKNEWMQSDLLNIEKDSVVLAELDPCGSIDLSTINEKVLSVQKPKRAVMSYKDKLGARVWWELEYTARKLEREELLERQQQARQRQASHDVKQVQRCTTEHLDMSKPTEWSNKDQSLKQQEQPIFPNKSAIRDQLVSSELCSTQKRAHTDRVRTPSSSTSSMKTLMTKTANASNHHGTDNQEAKAPSSCTLSSSKSYEKRTTGVKAIDVAKPIEGSPLACQYPGGDKAHPFAKASNLQERCLSSLCTRNKSSGFVSDGLHEKIEPRIPFSAKPAVSFEFVKTSAVVQSGSSTSQDDDDDEALAQLVWRSDRTSYEQDQNANMHLGFKDDDKLTTEAASVAPFTMHGRVPIRTRVKTTVLAADDASSSSSAEPSLHSHFAPRIHNDIPSKGHKFPARERLSGPHQVSNRLQIAPAKSALVPSTAFIRMERNDSTHDAHKPRQDRLDELRQIKLQKLQHTRNFSLQQQKEKLQQRQVQHLVSLHNSVRSKKASNRQLIQNALEFTLLAGGSMEKTRALALQALAESSSDNFIVLLKSAKELKFRALYENHADRDSATRVFSALPTSSTRAPLKIESSELISQFFKYSSAKKQFLSVPTRSFTVKTDACALADQFDINKAQHSSFSSFAI